ncbi:MAG: orotate phosphoribosyltransferase [Bacteroidales bacterium]|jgi:orotate phosphoribosyltransferase|nr:orotate phosphoribosyltransferase [Bacteroidales bacterium]
MESIKKQVARELLRISAVKIQPKEPFTWASGWSSPFYCDNRKALSYPDVRNLIRDSLCDAVKNFFPEFDVIAGVATGAIAQGALVADKLGKPFVYVRSAPKEHGLANLVEGYLEPGSRVVVIEDLVSTGGSSLKAVRALRDAGCTVTGMAASFTYGFPVAEEAFSKAGVKLVTLTDYPTMLAIALESDYIKKEDLKTLEEWRKNPSEWGK